MIVSVKGERDGSPSGIRYERWSASGQATASASADVPWVVKRPFGWPGNPAPSPGAEAHLITAVIALGLFSVVVT